MSKARRSLLVLGALVVLLAGAAAVFVATFDPNPYRGFILSQLSRSVNRPVEAAELELQLFPLRLRLRQLRIPEDPRFGGEEFIRAQAVQFDFSLGSLLRGQPELQALELDRPTVYLRQNAAGQWNLATLAAAPGEKKEKAAPAGPPAKPRLRNWLLRDGTIVVERAGQPPLRLTGVELVVRNLSTTAAFPFRLAVSFSPQSRVSGQGRLGPLNSTAPARTPLTAELRLENFPPATLASLPEVPATLARLGPLSGTLQVDSKAEGISLAGRVDLLGRQRGDNVSLQLAASLAGDFRRLVVRDAVVEYGGARLRGSGRATLAPPAAKRFDFALKTSNAELGSLGQLARRMGFTPPEVAPPVTGKLTADLKASGTPQAWRLTGTATLRDLAVTAPALPEPVRIAKLELALEPTRISTQPFTARLGNKLRARINFRLDNYRTRPALQARVETEAADLGALLGLLRTMGADPLPAGEASGRISTRMAVSGLLGEKPPRLTFSGQAQLRSASVKLTTLAAPLRIAEVNVAFGPNYLELTNLRLAAAGAKVDGSLRVDNFAAPRVGFDLRGDTLDTDRLQALFAPPRRAPTAGPAGRRQLGDSFLPVVHAQGKSTEWFGRLRGQGRLAFKRVRHGTLTLAPFSASVALANRVITCDPIEFGLYDGRGRGRLVVNLEGADPVTEFQGRLRNVKVNKLFSENSKSKDRLYGRLGGRVEVRFVGNERQRIMQSAEGKGRLSLAKGRLAQVSLSRELESMGQLSGLRFQQKQTPIEDLTTRFQIADGWVRTGKLTLRTPELTMTAAGGFSLEDELAFEATATFTPEASQRMTQRSPLGALVSNFFRDDQGRVVIPLLIEGTFAQPTFTLDVGRLVEMKLRRGRTQPGGRRGNIFDRLRRRKKPPQ